MKNNNYVLYKEGKYKTTFNGTKKEFEALPEEVQWLYLQAAKRAVKRSLVSNVEAEYEDAVRTTTGTTK